MTEHVSTSRMERFCVGGLPKAELAAISEHLTYCPLCHDLFADMLGRQRGPRPVSFTLAPEFLLRHDHVEFDQLAAIADNKLDETDREMIEIHLGACPNCQEDVRSFLAFRKEIEPELSVRYGPRTPTMPRGRTSPWIWSQSVIRNPVYAAAVLLIGMVLIIGVAVLLKLRASNLEAQKNQPKVNVGPPLQTPTPESRTAVNVQPTPSPVPPVQIPKPAPSPALIVKNREPIKRPESIGAVAALNDGGRTIMVNRAGNVSGLENIPAETRRHVAETLVAQNIEQPEIAKELFPTDINLRGPSAGQTFKLLSPGRTVIVAARPSFAWGKLAGATAYKVVVGDNRGHEVATSGDLSPDQTNWTPPKPLKRGETYAWNVIAIINGKEIISPGASASEMKFKVLSASSAQELDQLKKAASHLALGVFYATEGMAAEAEREFQVLVRENPQSPVLKKLLNEIQSWHKH